jgi:aspartokinase-like uncharacterized kinase
MTVAVYKLGGSLLALPDLAARLRWLFERETTHFRPLLISGGGPAADIVREWDRLHGLGEERAHFLALESLRLNESLLAELLPNSRIVRNREDADRLWEAGEFPILCASDFVQTEELCAALRLPHTWEVTSDSIAAWVAAIWPADRLVMVKSVSLVDRGQDRSPERSDGFDSARRVNRTAPLVDRYFHAISPHVREIRWINLRDDEFTVECWPGGLRE